MSEFWKKQDFSPDAIESTRKLLKILLPMEEEKIKNNEHGFAAIHIYALKNDLALELFLASGLNVNELTRKDKMTALQLAISQGHKEMVKLLLAYGADPYLQEGETLAPLFVAIQNNDLEMVKLLLECGVDPMKNCRVTDAMVNALVFSLASGKKEISSLLAKYNKVENLTPGTDRSDLIVKTQEQSCTIDKKTFSDNKFIIQSGEISFFDLPGNLQKKILEMQNEPKDDVIVLERTFRTSGLFTLLITTGIALLITYNIVTDGRWNLWYALGAAFGMTIATGLVWYALSLLIRNNIGKLRVGSYVIDAYIIETTKNFVRILPLWEIKNMSVEHHYDKNNNYSNSIVKFEYNNKSEETYASSKHKANQLVVEIETKISLLRQAVQSHDTAKMRELGMIDNIRLHPLYSLIKNSRKSFVPQFLFVVILACGITGMLWYWNNNMFVAPPKTMQEATFPAGKIENYLKNDEIELKNIATLEIDNSGKNKVIMILDHKTNKVVMKLYSGTKSKKRIVIPSGKYNVVVAEGATWYGDKYLFGENTFYNKSKHAFELLPHQSATMKFNVTDGNLSTEKILPAEFKNLK